MAAKLYLVTAKDYNGFKNVPFAMKDDDFRFGTPNYETVSPLKKVGKAFVATNTGRTYRRHADWSMTETTISA